MGLRLGSGISPCLFTFGGVEYDRPSLNPFILFAFYLLLACKVFRVHEMRSQLEVTEMLECKVKLTL